LTFASGGTTPQITLNSNGTTDFVTSTSSFATMNSTNANGGVLSFRRNGTNVGHIGNSAQLGGGVLDAIEVRSGTGSSVILKTDGGQLTLATGGEVTLTGALNGTSASFSGVITFAGNTRYGVSKIYDASIGDGFGFEQASAAQTSQGVPMTRIFTSATNGAALSLGKYTNASSFTDWLIFASTGAATFSSSVQGSRFFSVGSLNGTDGSFYIDHPGTQTWKIGITNANTSTFSIGNDNGGAFATKVLNITNAGNVGIGTASPVSLLNVYGSTHLQLQNATTGITAADGTRITLSGNDLQIINRESADVILYTTDTERMRITSEGDVLVGTQTNSSQRMRIDWSGGAGKWGIKMDASDGGAANLIEFLTGSTARGSITSNGTIVAYNVSSDYRLKEDLQEIKGLEKLQAIKVYNYKWKSEESRMDGVLAHELAEVLPYAVTGEKDEVDEEGNDKMQGVDYSKIVPILIKAIQELKTEIDSLKNQINK
jgi:hypothetical protein